MAVPNDRRIIYSAYVIPRDEETTEEGITTHAVLDTNIGKNFGGSGIVTITADQGGDGWVSYEHFKNTWDLDTTSNWEDDYTCWDGTLSVVNGSPQTLRASGTVLFLYVKNVGSNEAKLALEGDEYDILIPADTSVSMRVDSISAANIKVDTTSGTTEIEYIIAT